MEPQELPEPPEWVRAYGIKTAQDLKESDDLEKELWTKVVINHISKSELIALIAALDKSVEYKIFVMLNVQSQIESFIKFMKDVENNPEEMLAKILSQVHGKEMPPLPQPLQEAKDKLESLQRQYQ